MKRNCNKLRQGNAAIVYDDSGTYNNEIVHGVMTSEIILPALLAVSMSLPIQLDRRFVGDRPVSVMFDLGTNSFNINKNLVPRLASTG